MEIRDFLTGGSFVVSLVSLAITTYWNTLRGPQYISPPLLRLYFGCIPTTEIPIIVFPLIITNVGGRAGVVNSVHVDLINSSTKHSEKFYLSNGNEPNPGLYDFVEDPIKPILVKPNESFLEYFTFAPHSLDYRLEKGLYKIVVSAFADSRIKSKIVLGTQKIEILEVLNVNRGKLSDRVAWIGATESLPQPILKVSTSMGFQGKFNEYIKQSSE